jgi:hypothetical protein
MATMEGLMLVPPDRGSIIGRAVWKVSLTTLPLPPPPNFRLLYTE